MYIVYLYGVVVLCRNSICLVLPNMTYMRFLLCNGIPQTALVDRSPIKPNELKVMAFNVSDLGRRKNIIIVWLTWRAQLRA